MSKSGIVNINQNNQFEDIDIIRGVNYNIDNQGILEALLYTSGDEGLEQKQLLEILELNENELDQLIDTYQSPGLVIQKFGTTYVLTTKKTHRLILNSLLNKNLK